MSDVLGNHRGSFIGGSVVEWAARVGWGRFSSSALFTPPGAREQSNWKLTSLLPHTLLSRQRENGQTRINAQAAPASVLEQVAERYPHGRCHRT